MKKKKQNIWRKYFKTHYRAHLGYLVKYMANYIYIYILIFRRLTPLVHLLVNSKGNHVTGKKPLAAA
jgi:hypothetical protein